MPGRDERRDQRGEPDGLALVGLGLDRGGVGIERGRRRDGRAQGVERMAVAGQPAQQREQRRRDLAGRRQARAEGAGGVGRGQLAEPQELGHVLEGHGAGEIADLVAPVVETPGPAVDRAHGGTGGDHVLEPGFPRAVHRGPPRPGWVAPGRIT